MSKQLTYNPFTKELTLLTRLASEPIDKVIVTCKGAEPKEFKRPVTESVYGYNLYELFVTAQLLREHNITELDLKHYTDAFSLGYSQAHNELQNSIQNTIDNLIKDLRG